MISLGKPIIEHFKERKKTLFTLYEKSLEYFEIIKKLVSQEEPARVDKWEVNIRKYLEAIDAIESTIKKLKEKQSLGELFNNIIHLYDSFSEMEKLLEFMMNLVEDKKYIEQLLYTMSRTFVDETKRKAELISKIHQEYKEESGNESIMEDIYKELSVKENLEIVSRRIESVVSPNNFLIFLISKIVEELPKSNATKTILDKLEVLKDSALGLLDERYYKGTSSDLPLIQRLLVNFGLIPVMAFGRIEDIYSELREKTPENPSIEDLKERYGVLHLDRHGTRLINFSVRALIDKAYIIKEELETSQKSGLNKKIVRRFNTISSLPLESSGESQDEIAWYNEGATKHIIIDSFGGQYYRLLSDSYDCPFVSTDVIDKIRLGAHRRADVYAKTQEEIILVRGINSQHRNIIYEFLNFQESLPPIELLKEKIVLDVKDYFEKTFKPPGKDFYKDARRFMSSKPLISKINDIIAFRTYERLFEGGEKVKIEKKLSFLKNLNKTLLAFRRAYLIAMSALANEDIFIKYSKGEYQLSEDPKKDITEIYTSKVREVIEDLDSKPSAWEQFEPTLKDYVFARQLYTI